MNKHIDPINITKDHNKPPVLTPDELVKDYTHIDAALAEIEAQVKDVPTVIEDDEDLELARSAVKRCQSAYKRLETVRKDAKDPYLAAERVVDSHFNNRKDKVSGWQSDIEARAHRFLKKKQAEEQARRDEEARIAAEEARKAQEAQRKAEEERIAAEQARLAREQMNISKGDDEANPDAHDGEHFNALESAARQEETVARERALAATAEALSKAKAADAKPADLARTRTGDGLSTLEEVWKFEITDLKAAMKDETLLSFISTAEVEKAVARYVKTHKGDRPLNGVRIYADTKPRMT